MNQMTREEAFKMLDNAIASMSVNRATHHTLINALNKLGEAVTVPEKKTEAKKPDDNVKELKQPTKKV